MSIPPVEKYLFKTTTPSQESKALESEKTVSDDFQKAETAVPKAIKNSESIRENKLQRLPQSISSQVKTL